MHFTVTNLRLTLQNPLPEVSPDALNDAQFSFDDIWRYTSIWANLESNGLAYRLKIENGVITADCITNLPEGRWNIYLKGEKYSDNGTLLKEIVTNICSFTVKDTAENSVCRYRPVSASTIDEQTKFLAQQASDLAREILRLKESGNYRGPKGDTGPQGPAGQNGTNGADGYTPVRGTDYWTAADIATIKEYVDDAILGGAW